MLKKLNALTFFLFWQKYFIIFNFLLCTFKIIIIIIIIIIITTLIIIIIIIITKNIIHVQCQRWVMKSSLKEKHLVIWKAFVIRKKLVLRKDDRETFLDIIFYIFDKWRKRVKKKYETNIDEKLLMLCADEVSSGKQAIS